MECQMFTEWREHTKSSLPLLWLNSVLPLSYSRPPCSLPTPFHEPLADETPNRICLGWRICIKRPGGTAPWGRVRAITRPRKFHAGRCAWATRCCSSLELRDSWRSWGWRK